MDHLRYLRIRYQHQGRGWQAGDCLNLLRLFYLEEFGIELDDYTGYPENWAELGMNLFLDHQEDRGFCQVKTPAFGDAVLFQINQRVLHCGVVLDPAKGLFLHTSRKGTFIENYILSIWAGRVYGFYHHKQRE